MRFEITIGDRRADPRGPFRRRAREKPPSLRILKPGPEHKQPPDPGTIKNTSEGRSWVGSLFVFTEGWGKGGGPETSRF